MVKIKCVVKVLLEHEYYDSTISEEPKSLIKFNLHPNSSQHIFWVWFPEAEFQTTKYPKVEFIHSLDEPITGYNIQMERDMVLNSNPYNVLSDVIRNVFFASDDGYDRHDELADLIMSKSREIIENTCSNMSVGISMDIRVVAGISVEKVDMMKYLKKRSVIEFENSNEDEESSCCAICLEDFTSKSTCLIPCLHPFHQDCILQWLERNYRCPMCRSDEMINEVIDQLGCDEGEENNVP